MSSELIVLITGVVAPTILTILGFIIKRAESANAHRMALEESKESEYDKAQTEMVNWREKYFTEKDARLQAEIEAKQLRADLVRLTAELESYKNRYQKGA
ncbi:MAG: hypothetical protein WC822_06295 [Candidatus Paceibacterota bacterium]|jgi:molecular chaperone GrpE (heat shock protein)